MEITLEEANKMMQVAIAKAHELKIKISVAVCDSGGRLVAFNKMDGAIWGAFTGARARLSPPSPSANPAENFKPVPIAPSYAELPMPKAGT